MTHSYRGYPFPEIIRVDGWYWIIDDKFGQHWGHTPGVAIISWKNKVDSVIILDALEMGLIERVGTGEDFACDECGLVIYDVFKHLNWHKTH